MTADTAALIDLAVKIGTPAGFLAIVGWSAWMLVPAALKRMQSANEQGIQIAEALGTIAETSTTTGELLVSMDGKLDLVVHYAQEALVQRNLEKAHASRPGDRKG